MHTAHFWHKLNLHRTKIIVLLILVCSLQVTAQSRRAGVTQHRLESDQKPLKYGFFLGGHQNYYGLQYADAFSEGGYDNVTSITPRKSFGFNLGFMVNLRFHDQVSVRLIPVKIGLYQYNVDYNFVDGTVDEQLIESTRFEPGIFIKYRSIRRENTRMYLIAGVSSSIRSGQVNEDPTQDRLQVTKSNFQFEIGIGLEKYFEFFTFAPEFRYARSFGNVMADVDNFYHNGINRLATHTFSFYFFFSD